MCLTFDLYYDLYSDLYCMLLDLGLDLHACLESQKTEVKGLDLFSADIFLQINILQALSSKKTIQLKSFADDPKFVSIVYLKSDSLPK